MLKEDEISGYYNYLQPLYRLLWAGSSHAIHYGIWLPHIRSHREALLATNHIMADLVSISEQDIVLDAGCGMGGSTLWLAHKRGAITTGITISRTQAKFACQTSARSQIAHLVSFSVQDYLATAFPDSSFTVVWAIESICHTERKAQFVQEAFRLLKPEGRLVIADGFIAEDPKSGKDVVVDLSDNIKLVTLEQFYAYLMEAGFRSIDHQEFTSFILPSAKRIYILSLLVKPFINFLEKYGKVSPILISAIKGGIQQYRIIQSRYIKYIILKAEK